MRLILRLLRPFFYLLYHQFAWTYDFVAACVSLGHWKAWVLGTLPYIKGQSVLEVGHGPGHLQLALNEAGYQVYGLDESRFMSRLASSRLKKKQYPLRLSRGYAQDLPFAHDSFDSLVSTFPTEYIFDPQTLAEVHRVLTPGGQLVILPVAWITGGRPLERLAAWLFRVTGQAQGQPGQLNPLIQERFTRAGFHVRGEAVRQGPSLLLFIIASKAGQRKSF